MWTFLLHAFGKRVWAWLFIIVVGLLVLFAPSPFANSQSNTASEVLVLTLNDEVVSPITADYIRRGLQQASERQAKAVVIQLDTPGGLLASTHEIVKQELNAAVPVIVYVAPAGARAGSAGVFITLAAHVAAMAPSTRIGAAHPVDVNGKWPSGPEGEKGAAGEESVMSQKVLNDTVAGIRAIAKARGRNEDFAVRAVTKSVSLTAEEAQKEGVVDLVAESLPSLLTALEGRTVTVQGKSQVLQLESARVVDYTFSTRERFLGILTHPFLAYILLMIGFYGLLFEVTHPGILFPGIAGAICLILALIGMQTLPVNLGGLGLIGLGLILFIAEVFTPAFGALFTGGFVAVVLGTLFLYQSEDPYLRQLAPVMTVVSSLLAGFTGLVLWKIMKARRIKAKDPYQKMIGQLGRVTLAIEPSRPGKVKVYGETWDAEAEEALSEGVEVKVVEVNPQDHRVLKVVRYTV